MMAGEFTSVDFTYRKHKDVIIFYVDNLVNELQLCNQGEKNNNILP